MNRIFAAVMLAALMLGAGARDCYALTDPQRLTMEKEMNKLVKQREAELREQKSELELRQKKEDDAAQLETRSLENELKLAKYWVKRLGAQGESVRLAEWQEKLEALKAKLARLEAEDAERKQDHKQQLADMEQRQDEERAELEAAQTRFRAAMLLDRTGDYDYALGVALGAYSDSRWSLQNPILNHCRMVKVDLGNVTSWVIECKDQYNK